MMRNERLRHAASYCVSVVFALTNCGNCAFHTPYNHWGTPLSPSFHFVENQRIASSRIPSRVARTLSAHLAADIVLSSGQCAFAAHCGFLEGVERSLTRERIGAVVGTSTGALTGEFSCNR